MLKSNTRNLCVALLSIKMYDNLMKLRQLSYFILIKLLKLNVLEFLENV